MRHDRGVTPDEIARRSAAAMWADDRASQALGMELREVGPGRAVLAMTVREDMVNGHAIGHGGLTFALADSAFAFACNSYNRTHGRGGCRDQVPRADPARRRAGRHRGGAHAARAATGSTT